MKYLKHVAAFKDFKKKELDKIVDVLDLQDFRKDETVIKKGQPATTFFLIKQGTVGFDLGDDVIKETRGVSEYFGEVARGPLEGGDCTATVIAQTDCKFFVLSKIDFDRLVKESLGEALDPLHNGMPDLLDAGCAEGWSGNNCSSARPELGGAPSVRLMPHMTTLDKEEKVVHSEKNLSLADSSVISHSAISRSDTVVASSGRGGSEPYPVMKKEASCEIQMHQGMRNKETKAMQMDEQAIELKNQPLVNYNVLISCDFQTSSIAGDAQDPVKNEEMSCTISPRSVEPEHSDEAQEFVHWEDKNLHLVKEQMEEKVICIVKKDLGFFDGIPDASPASGAIDGGPGGARRSFRRTIQPGSLAPPHSIAQPAMRKAKGIAQPSIMNSSLCFSEEIMCTGDLKPPAMPSPCFEPEDISGAISSPAKSPHQQRKSAGRLVNHAARNSIEGAIDSVKKGLRANVHMDSRTKKDTKRGWIAFAMLAMSMCHVSQAQECTFPSSTVGYIVTNVPTLGVPDTGVAAGINTAGPTSTAALGQISCDSAQGWAGNAQASCDDATVSPDSVFGDQVSASIPCDQDLGYAALSPDGRVLTTPKAPHESGTDCAHVSIFDPTTNEVDNSIVIQEPPGGLNYDCSATGSIQWGDLVLAPNNKMYGVPRCSTAVLIVDLSSSTADTTAISGIPDTPTGYDYHNGLTSSNFQKWMAAALAPNGYIYCLPFYSQSILIIDPQSLAGRAACKAHRQQSKASRGRSHDRRCQSKRTRRRLTIPQQRTVQLNTDRTKWYCHRRCRPDLPHSRYKLRLSRARDRTRHYPSIARVCNRYRES
eukprot:COSAG06_NODE_3868_length_4816_cov_1.817469_2_plen_820_part_00